MNTPNMPTATPRDLARCDCCWRTEDEFNEPLTLGQLTMPMRRIFRVCQDCVNFMWHGRSQLGELDIILHD